VAVVAGVLIIGIASLSALLVQTSFQGDDLRTRLTSLQQQHEVLREQVAADSSPQRIMEWARVRGMQMPERVVILHLPAAEAARVTRPPAGRLIALFVGMSLALGGLVVRLGVLQVRESGAYAALGIEQRLRTEQLNATRAKILDRSGSPLAVTWRHGTCT
jgi:hypothetical protein